MTTTLSIPLRNSYYLADVMPQLWTDRHEEKHEAGYGRLRGGAAPFPTIPAFYTA